MFSSHHDGGSSSTKLTNLLWKDKSLCFDLRQSDLEINHGEQLIGCFFPIEDVKGNQDEMGLLKVTNLRLIWNCCNRKRVNLSIGWRTINLAFEQNLKDSLGRPVTSLCIISKFESTKYEFVFNKMPAHDMMWNSDDDWNISMQLKKYINQNDDKTVTIGHLSPMYLDDPFEVVFKIWNCYRQTSLFRHCRANLTNLMPKDSYAQQTVKLDEYSKLPGEETIDIYNEVVQTESRSIEYTGSLILTNIRLIWLDGMLPLRNLSIPYIRGKSRSCNHFESYILYISTNLQVFFYPINLILTVDSMKIKQNRILIKTLDYLATSNKIELRLDKTLEASKVKLEQVQNLYRLYKARPKFGPECCEESLIYMSHLRPVEHYLDSPFDEPAKLDIENFGPERSGIYPVISNQSTDQQADFRRRSQQTKNIVGSDIENTENELFKYRIKLNKYLNDQPIERDNEISYSKGR